MTEEQAVLAANAEFYRAFQRKEMDAMAAIWSQGSASLCIHPGRHALKGWEAVRDSWEKIFWATSSLEMDIEVVGTEVNGDLAYVVVIESVLQVAGGHRHKALSMATNIFERMGGRWYLVHHHGSPLMG